MRVKQLLASVLAAALTVSLLVLPASAAPGSFSDVSDPATAVNTDILRLMGVVSGTGGNRFNPDGTLTRAQFCTMVVNFLQKGDEVPRYATRTIFSDVKGSHWARGYINLAASYQIQEGGEGSASLPLVSGVGDGRFLPDNNITMGEAVTIVLRAMKYTGQQAGAVWPKGYMDLAQSIGLSDGVAAGAYDTITRAQAAQLFVNALSCEDASGQAYYKSLGTVPGDPAIILAVNVETDDGGSRGAVRTSLNDSSEAYLPAHGDGNVPALQGKRGNLVLNERGDQIVAFVPDDSTATTITLSGDAQPAYVKASNGRQYTISSGTKVYTSANGSSQSYLEAYTTLTSGTQITMYSEKGKVVAIYSTSSATSIDSDAVVVMGGASTASFHQLTGGVTDFKIVKNRQSISLSDIKDYDVVTYDRLSNTLMVSDLRLTCVYKDASPNIKTPSSVWIANGSESGYEFEVLESAWESCASFRPGDTVTLLLTADGNVAGMAAVNKARSTAVGYVDNGTVEMLLPSGGKKEIGTVSNDNVQNQLVTISATKSGISASRLSSRTAPGAFDVNGMKLGSYIVTAGVRVYEQVKGGAMVAVDRGDLGTGSIPAGQIASYHLNSSNMVDYIVLNDVTGDAYEYGMMVSEPRTVPSETEGEDPTTKTGWKLMRHDGPFEFVNSMGYSGRSGDMVGVVKGTPMGQKDGGDYTIKAIVQLTEVKGVKASAFFDSQGVPHVTANGRTYRVADDVECCRNLTSSRNDPDNWLRQDSGKDRLAAIRAYADSFTIYVDPIGQQVRVIAAN